jgi:16S rRNA (guanine966-N2)-methyltransferase
MVYSEIPFCRLKHPMQITGGKGRGLRIDAPPGQQTRPTTDRVRESLFGILRDIIPEAKVLDLFAGSGSLGLEAASRGAQSVCWVEKHPPAAKLIQSNFDRLAPAGVHAEGQIRIKDVLLWLKHPDSEPVDLIFADPPYKMMESSGTLSAFLNQISQSGILTTDGLLILELSRRSAVDLPENWSMLRRQAYGGTAVYFLERSEV